MFDPIKLSKEVEEVVTRKTSKGVKKLYARFRSARFYGGISSCDTCGCNLRCKFCWAWRFVTQPEKYGKFYPPKEVADRLIKIAKKNNFFHVRITGGEPTIGKEHLIEVLRAVPSELTFILETNGILLGSDKSYVKKLKEFDNLHVRVSLKGCTENEFSKLTGAVPEAFQLQLDALKFCLANGVSCHPAVLIDLVEKNNLNALKKRLAGINEKLADNLEFETLITYPHVVKRLKKANLW